MTGYPWQISPKDPAAAVHKRWIWLLIAVLSIKFWGKTKLFKNKKTVPFITLSEGNGQF